MPEMHLFEYAVIRVVPRVEREEFLNAGVILYCRNLRFLEARYILDEARLRTAFPGINLPELQQYLDAFCSIAAGAQPASPIAGLDVASRFRWLTATRSTVLQTSKVHPGHCGDPTQQLEHLLQSFVLPETPGNG
jgi:hypothetical protein